MPSFPSARVINLDRSPQRWEAIAARLGALGSPFERVAGVDGRAEPERCAAACDQRAVEAYMRRPLINGEIACALGHLEIWRSLAETDEEMFLVLEDDADFDESLLVLPDLIAALPDDWEILLLSTKGRQPLWSKTVGEHEVVRYHRPATFAIGYVIHRRLLAKRREWDQPVRFAFDMWRFWAWRHGLVLYASNPRLVHHLQDQKSTISGSETRVTARPGLVTILRGALLRLGLYPRAWWQRRTVRRGL